MRRHTVFRDNPYTHTVVFPDSYPLPATDKIKMQVRRDRSIIVGIDPEISVTGKRVTYTYSPALLAKLPQIVDQYLVLDGDTILGGQLGVLIGYGEQEESETHVTIADGEVTVVEVMGLELVEAQVDIATQKAAQTAEDAVQTAGDRAATAADRIQTGQDANTATEKAGEAANSASIAVDAMNVAIENSPERIDVATYAAAVPYFSGSRAREIYVAADEAYYEGEDSWYRYVPGKGEALLGMDFNYKA